MILPLHERQRSASRNCQKQFLLSYRTDRITQQAPIWYMSIGNGAAWEVVSFASDVVPYCLRLSRAYRNYSLMENRRCACYPHHSRLNSPFRALMGLINLKVSASNACLLHSPFGKYSTFPLSLSSESGNPKVPKRRFFLLFRRDVLAKRFSSQNFFRFSG